MTGNKKPLTAATVKGSGSRSSLNNIDNSLGNQEVGLDARLSRYYSAKQRALVNRKALRSAATSETPDTPKALRYASASAKLRGCGNYLVFNDYFTKGITRLSKASFCKQHLICPLCAIRRSAKTLQSYLDRYKVIMQENPTYRLSMITLTVKNGADLRERLEHLQKSQRTLFDRRRDWLKKGWGKTEFRKIHGWVGTHEFTNKGKGWHPHSHIMVLHTENFDYSALIAEWKAVTGDSCNINVTAAMNPQAPELDFIEVFKYAVKFSDLTPEQNIHAWDVLRGKRLLFSGGAFRGVEVPETLTDDLLDDLDYIERFYVADRKGYSLQSSRLVQMTPPVSHVEPASVARGSVAVAPIENTADRSLNHISQTCQPDSSQAQLVSNPVDVSDLPT